MLRSMARIKHYGWMVSPYSAKTRSYLRYKGTDFEDRAPSFLELKLKIERKVGVVIMPSVELPDGSFLKDSSEIIDHFERLSPEPSITPRTPRQRVASAVLEVFADEWLVLPALMYRWTRPASIAFAIEEFGKDGAPFLPRTLRHAMGRAFGRKMAAYLPMFGITPETGPEIEAMTEAVIAALDEVLAETPYILGGRPCMGDFALYGPLYAHLFRDPGSNGLFDRAPHVRAWIERLHAPRVLGDFLEDDAIPSGVERLLEIAFRVQWPYLTKLREAIDAYCDAHRDASRVPRALGDTEISIGRYRVRRKMVTAAQWKMQRAVRAFAETSGEERESVTAMLESVGGVEAITQTVRHPLAHVANRFVLA